MPKKGVKKGTLIFYQKNGCPLFEKWVSPFSESEEPSPPVNP